jgi:poly(A) polymerase
MDAEGGARIEDPRIRAEDIDPQALSAIKRLKRYGYKGYLVGGCVRDLLLGIAPKDFDIATDARPEEVKGVFRNSRIIGRRFRLVHLYYRGGKVLEVATFRAAVASEDDPEDGDLLIRRDNVFGTEQEDAQRRDFTINALFYDPEDRCIIDHVGGLEDIDGGTVRMIGDPDIRLREDPVRIIRAIRFRAKAGLTIEPSLEAALGRHVEELVRCPPARLLEETLKLLRMGHACASFDLMREHGVLDVLLPEVQAFVAGHLTLLAGSEVMDDLDPLTEIRNHLTSLDAVVERGPVPDDVVLGALLLPMAEAVMAHADAQGRDRSKAVAQLLSEVGVRVQITRKISESLRQSFAALRHFPSEVGTGRRRRRMSPSALVRRAFFSNALRLFEIQLRARALARGQPPDLDEVLGWEAKARDEDAYVAAPLSSEGSSPNASPPGEASRRRKRRGGRKRKRTPAG